MDAQLSVADMLRAAAQQMWVDFDRAAQVSHPGEKGRAREDALRSFLADYLPGRFGVGTGFVIDATQRASAQMDVAIFDKASAPVFKISESVQLFPVESVAAVLQVKSFLSGSELDSAMVNLESAIELDRFTGMQFSAMMGGVMQKLIPPEDEGYAEYEVQAEPILAGIFAFRGEALPTVAARLKGSDLPDLQLRIPLVCVLDQGVISYSLRNQLAPYHAYDPRARLAYTTEDDRSRTLHFFYSLLAHGVSRKIPLAPSYARYSDLGVFPLDFVE